MARRRRTLKHCSARPTLMTMKHCVARTQLEPSGHLLIVNPCKYIAHLWFIFFSLLPCLYVIYWRSLRSSPSYWFPSLTPSRLLTVSPRSPELGRVPQPRWAMGARLLANDPREPMRRDQPRHARWRCHSSAPSSGTSPRLRRFLHCFDGQSCSRANFNQAHNHPCWQGLHCVSPISSHEPCTRRSTQPSTGTVTFDEGEMLWEAEKGR